MVTVAALPPSLLLVGVGRFGREHLKEWQALATEGRMRIAGIVASSATSRDRLNTETGLPTFASLADGLAIAPDMVDICTPSSLHPAMVREAIAHADVLVEKPLAFTGAKPRIFMRWPVRPGAVWLPATSIVTTLWSPH